MKFLLKLLLLLLSLMAIIYFMLAIWVKTGNGNKAISKFITKYVTEVTDYKYSLEIEGMNFSFPLSTEIKELRLAYNNDIGKDLDKDKNGKILIIQDLCINLKPSLLWFWKVDIWNISAKQLNLLKLPAITEKTITAITEKNTEVEANKVINGVLDFIPNINIQNILFNKITLSSELTSMASDVSINLNGSLNFNSLNKTLHFSTRIVPEKNINEILDESIKETLKKNGDIFSEIIGKYSFIDNNLVIENYKISAFDSVIEGDFGFDFSSDLITGRTIYETSILKNLISSQKVAKSFCTGGVDFSGKIDSPIIKAGGQAFLEFEDQDYFRLPKLVWKASWGGGGLLRNGKLSITTGPIKLLGDITKDDSKIYLKNFSIKGRELSGIVNLFFDTSTNNLVADLALNSPNINELSAFFPPINKGAINIKTHYVQNNLSSKSANIIGSINNLSVGSLSCELMDINIAVSDIPNLKMDKSFLKVQHFLAGDYSLKNFMLEGKWENDAVNFMGYAESFYPYPFNLKVNGKLNSIGKLSSGKLSSSNQKKLNLTADVKGKIGRAQISTGQSIIISFDEILQFSAPLIKANEGIMSLEMLLEKELINGKLVIKNFPVAIFPYLLPTVFDKSSVSGEIELTGNKANPKLESKLNIINLDLKDNEVFANLQISSHINNDIFFIDAQLQKVGKILSSIQVQLPYRFSISPFESSIVAKEKLSINCKFEEARIASLLPLPFGHKLSGYINGYFNIYGFIGALLIDGEARISKAEYMYQQYGIRLRNIAAKIIAQNQNISIKQFVTEDAKGNKIVGEGFVSMKQDLPFKFNLTTNKFNLVNNSYLQGELAGDLSISGNDKRALAKGNFTIGPMEFKIPERFSDNIPTVNIVGNKDQDKKGTDDLSSENKYIPYVLDLDIGLSAKAQVYVRGWGVDTLLVGDLKINNTVNDPHIFGKLHSVKGKYQEFGKTLTVREGVLTFNGPISPSPYINIIGFNVVSGTEIRLILSGSIFAPDISIESTPSLSQENALSLLLFRKNTDSISVPQAVSLTSSMARLSGHGGGFDVLDLGKKLLPVDDITFNQDEKTDSTVIGIGKYLTDRVYVEFEQGNQTTGSKQRVEVEVTPKVSIEGSLSTKDGSSLGVNWRFDY